MDKIQATTAKELRGRRTYLRWRDACNSQGAGERGEESRGGVAAGGEPKTCRSVEPWRGGGGDEDVDNTSEVSL